MNQNLIVYDIPLITSYELRLICSPFRVLPEELSETLSDSLNQTFYKYKIDTEMRIAHFLAQVMHESGLFRYNEEIWRDTKAQRSYEGREDLGNTHQGDGYRYRGRGYIQLTGRRNYERFASDLGVDFISTPELVSQSPYNIVSAGWYWDKRDLNKYADVDDLRAVTLRVNGGYNGMSDRAKCLNQAKTILM